MTAKQIGSHIAVKSSIMGIIIAYSIMAVFVGLDEGINAIIWIIDFDYWPNLLSGAVGLIVMAYLFGKQAGTKIIEQKKNSFWIGINYGFLVLISGTLIGSTPGFILEGLDNIGKQNNPFIDYYFKPLFWVMIFGSIPVVLVGIWFGETIKKLGKANKL